MKELKALINAFGKNNSLKAVLVLKGDHEVTLQHNGMESKVPYNIELIADDVKDGDTVQATIIKGNDIQILSVAAYKARTKKEEAQAAPSSSTPLGGVERF